MRSERIASSDLPMFERAHRLPGADHPWPWILGVVVMDCNKCKFWTGSVCADPNDWVNESGDHVCRFQVGAISLDEKLFNEHLQSELETLRRQNTELERKNKVLMEYFEANEKYCPMCGVGMSTVSEYERLEIAREAVREMLREVK